MAKPIDEKYNEDILKAFLTGFSVDLNHLRVAVKDLQHKNVLRIAYLEAQVRELEKGQSNAG